MSCKPISIFIIYAKEDREKKRRLLAHLNPFVEAYDVALWHDEYIEPGQEWDKEIVSKLKRTDIFLLLVSVDFMNSEFIRKVELRTALDMLKAKRSVVIPLIINYCQWDVDFIYPDYHFNLKSMQVLPPEGKPLDEWSTPDKAYNEIAAGVRKVITSIKNERETNSRFNPSKEAIYRNVEVEAGFPGGEEAWKDYLRKNLNPDVAVDLGAAEETYTIVVKFVIDMEGNICDVAAENNPGYGISEEVIRVIRSSPKWTPAIQNGRNVNAYRRQPVTFIVESE